MKKSALFKNSIITMEVLLCITALLLLCFRHPVSGSQLDSGNGLADAEIFAEETDTEVTDLLETEPEEDIIADTLTQETEAEAPVKEDVNEVAGTEMTAEEEIAPEPELPAKEEIWSLTLANKNAYIPIDYMPDLVTISGGKQVDERIAEDVENMLQAAKEDGVRLNIVSAYRSVEKQRRLFDKKVRKYKGKGMDLSEATEEASRSVAIPGTSEHQLGLALDILGSGYGSLNEGFGDSEAGRWLADHCAEYGFILRYPAGKEDVTGIIYEPWHFRYVGTPYAQEITDAGLTLEEYLEE